MHINGLKDKEDMVYIDMQWNITQEFLKMVKSCHCNNRDRPWGYYAKWNTSNKERQILTPYDFTHMQNIKNKLKKQMNKPNEKNKENPKTCRYKEQSSGYRREGVGRKAKCVMGINCVMNGN